MNFFNSIFSDDPDPIESDPYPKIPNQDTIDTTEPDNPNGSNPSTEPVSPAAPNPNLWNFGSLIKTIANRSESVIGTYRRDFEEFGSGLLKETSTIRDVASQAVKEFPDSIDVGAAVAQESLESVGQVIDNLGSSVWQGTTQIIARGKDLHLFDEDEDGVSYNNDDGHSTGVRDRHSGERSLNVKKYSWFDSRMREIQSDSRTYCEDPEDLEDYEKWRVGFVLDGKGEEIQRLIGEERAVERIYLELVPVTVDKETFWTRYFYKVDKLKQAEEARARLVKRAVSGEDEEDLSWDVDDDYDDDVGNRKDDGVNLRYKNNSGTLSAEKEMVKISPDEAFEEVNKDKGVFESSITAHVKPSLTTETRRVSTASDSSSIAKIHEAKVPNEKADNGDSCKDSDLSIVSTQPSLPEVEELGWDEIGDVGSDNDDHKVPEVSCSSNISDLRKRLNAAEEEEDLSWDIEDDDEPVNS